MNRMKRTLDCLVLFAAFIALVSCKTEQGTGFHSLGEEARGWKEVPFAVANNYFFKNGQSIPTNPKVVTDEDFNRLFGMATTMGPDGKPTEIDFSKQFVLAIVLPVTDVETDIKPMKVETKGQMLRYTYAVKAGQKQSYSTQPVAIILIDRKYKDQDIVLSKGEK